MVKGETVMPVPGGEITTSEILIPAAQVEAALDAALAAADAEEAEDDLPELS
jgi:hypothetical protein